MRPAHDGTYMCRVCGAPIATSDLDVPVIECKHCRAHNVFDRTVSLSAAEEEVVAFDQFEKRARARARRSKPNPLGVFVLLVFPFAMLVALLVGLPMLDRRLTKEFHPDESLVARAYTNEGHEECLTLLPLSDEPYLPVHPSALRPLIGVHVHGPTQADFVVARLGKDGWGRPWLESSDGAWRRPDDFCYAPK